MIFGRRGTPQRRQARPARGNPDHAACSGDRIQVSGEATWAGNAETGNVNVGNVDGMTHLEGNHARYDTDGCHFAIEFVPDALIVGGDNGA